jgi:RNA polymerase sigma-70 factor (ECF subfamily)
MRAATRQPSGERSDGPLPDTPLSGITTLWSVVCRAHGSRPEAAAAAQQELLERYGKAVQRYLLGAVRDPGVADDLAQEFAVRFLQGDMRGADPQRGRFRDFVKAVLLHLIADYYRKKKARPLPGGVEAVVDAHDAPDHPAFEESWGDELLNRTWKALANSDDQSGHLFYAVLRFRAEHPDLRSAQMAEQLAGQFGKRVTADWVRQTLHRARDRFADLLLQEVADTLNNPSGVELEQELIDLGLLVYCKTALQRLESRSRRRGGPTVPAPARASSPSSTARP